MILFLDEDWVAIIIVIIKTQCAEKADCVGISVGNHCLGRSRAGNGTGMRCCAQCHGPFLLAEILCKLM